MVLSSLGYRRALPSARSRLGATPLLLALVLFTVTPGASARGGDSSGQEEHFREVPVLNAGLESGSPEVSPDTPQALMEVLLGAYRRGDFELAAHCLNLNAIRPEEQALQGPL